MFTTSKTRLRLIAFGGDGGGGMAGVFSLNGRDGAVVVTKTDVGLGNVDNTSDLSKPVSTLQQSAIDAVAANFNNINQRNVKTIHDATLAEGFFGIDNNGIYWTDGAL